MVRSASLISLSVATTLLAAGPLASTAYAQQQASQRCEGTLCDIYYGSSKPTAAAEPVAAPTPLTAPSTGNFLSNMFSSSGAAPAQGGAATAPQRSSLVNVGGGGLAGNNRATECGGTICDLFHGHSGSADDVPLSQSQSGTPQSRFSSFTAPAQSAEPVAEPAAAPVPAAPAAVPQRRVADRAPPPKPSCVARGGDPWSCYRH